MVTMIKGQVILIPTSQRAKNRINEHGPEMLLLKEEDDKFLVQSLEDTFKGEKWMGWFTKEECFFVRRKFTPEEREQEKKVQIRRIKKENPGISDDGIRYMVLYENDDWSD